MCCVFAYSWLRDGRLEACLFAGPAPVAAEREWLAGVFAHATLSPVDRMSLLAGRPPREPVVQYGPFVMNTREEIEQAVRDFQSGALTLPAR